MKRPKAAVGFATWGWLRLALGLFGIGCPWAGFADDPKATGATLSGHYVRVVDALRELGLRPSARMTPEGEQTFANTWRQIDFRHDSREILIDGRRVFLGEGVHAQTGELWLSRVDVEKLLRPVVRPRAFAESARPVQIIWIDAGHGGRDRGAHSDPLALSEKHIALDVSLRLGKILSAQGFEVRHTRTEDVYVDIGDRGEMSRAADLLVSIHFNAAGNPEARGTEVYALTPAGQPSTSDRSPSAGDYPVELGNTTDPWNALLGFAVHDAMIKRLGTVDRGLKRARFAVLRLTDVPAVLIEAGFLSHEAEAQEIASADRRREIAESIADGIVDYVDLVLSLSPSP